MLVAATDDQECHDERTRSRTPTPNPAMGSETASVSVCEFVVPAGQFAVGKIGVDVLSANETTFEADSVSGRRRRGGIHRR